MAEPTQPDMNLVDRALDWADVLKTPVGKDRFRAVRAKLRDYLRDNAGAPNVSKQFLSEKLIMEAGKSADPEKLPPKLRAILGNEDAQREFAAELHLAYGVMRGTAPKKDMQALYDAGVDNLEEAGASQENLDYLRRLGPTAFISAMGPAFLFQSAQTAKKSPEIKSVLSRLGKKMLPVSSATTESLVPVSTAPIMETGIKGVAKSVLSAAMKPAMLAGLEIGGLALGVGGAFQDVNTQEATGNAMAQTGMLPAQYGAANMPGVFDPKGQPVSSAKFLDMLALRQDQLKAARFSAATQEQGLTRDVLSYLAGGPQQEQRQVQRMQLGAARPAQLTPPTTDQVMKNFDLFLRQAAGGGQSADVGE